MPLKEMRLFESAINPQVLRQINTLEKMNSVPGAEFWQAYAKESEGPQP